MQAVRDAGLPFVIATGRMYRSAKRYLEDLGIAGPIVCYQGAVVADAAGTFVRHVPIPLEPAREAIAAIVAGGHHVNVYVDDELYVSEVTPEARAYADFQDLPIHAVGDLLEWLDRPPTKVVAVGERTLAFGDGENDIELVQAAGYGIAVANAHDRVLEAADFVCPPASEEGVAQVLEAFLDLRE